MLEIDGWLKRGGGEESAEHLVAAKRRYRSPNF